MGTLLIDASVILAAFDADDRNHGAARELLADPDVTLATLDLVRYEVTNVAVCAWKTPGRVSGLLDAVDQVARDGGVLVSTVALLTGAAQLAAEHEISVYDAAYVAGARHSGATLVSCDVRDLVGNGLAHLPEAAKSR